MAAANLGHVFVAAELLASASVSAWRRFHGPRLVAIVVQTATADAMDSI